MKVNFSFISNRMIIGMSIELCWLQHATVKLWQPASLCVPVCVHVWVHVSDCVCVSLPFCISLCNIVSQDFLHPRMPPCASEKSALHVVQWARFGPHLAGRRILLLENLMASFLLWNSYFIVTWQFSDSTCWTLLKICTRTLRPRLTYSCWMQLPKKTVTFVSKLTSKLLLN